MPTQLDRSLQSRNLFFGFAGIVTAVSAWMIWVPSDIMPKREPAGDPEAWSDFELKMYLHDRNLHVGKASTREELVASVKAIRRAPK